MRDGFSLDQIRAFIAAVEEGSFSGAGRRIGCTQSAISEMIRRLEEETGLQLFDRATRSPKLTTAGKTLLTEAKTLAAAADRLNFLAQGMSQGLEPELCVVVDVYFPFQQVAEAAKDFQLKFPSVPLRIYVEVLGGALEPLLDRRACIAVVGEPALGSEAIASEKLLDVEIIPVASPEHPLAAIEGVISRGELANHIQLVLTERTTIKSTPDHNVRSPSTWRLADFFAKRSFLLNGLGWGSAPRHTVVRDLDLGRLKMLKIEDYPQPSLIVSMFAAYLKSSPPGPGGRWMIDRLKAAPAE